MMLKADNNVQVSNTPERGPQMCISQSEVNRASQVGLNSSHKTFAGMSPITVIDLTGAGWHLTGERHTDLPVAVPVHALQALHDADLVPDPLYRYVKPATLIIAAASVSLCVLIRFQIGALHA